MTNKHTLPELTAVQGEVLTGVLVGDGHLDTTTNRTFRLKLEQSIDKKCYMFELFRIFEPFGTQGAVPQIVSYGVSNNWKYQT